MTVGNGYDGGVLSAELVGTPTAWKSMPGVVRLAVWIWALTVVLSVIGGVLTGLVFLLALAGS